MKNKLSSLQTLIALLTIGILAWDILLCLTRHMRSLPHQDMVLTGSLLWLVSLFFPQQSDDDWAGQF
ncbi:hypothetical protein [Mucilaginibacter gotjawali]|uniref:Uncharacterized protein n=2 Tax=Mucilaginibacter gotjawali TaxID=1550579 RepID=A0A125T2A5_9SPHI|nr:hypothetical protein [Mucilaginibacter gotjawali]MBB3056588.1 hypothetical protein [Mucilaginibacter gotjawali]BAU52708.1 hypothetical protein MgSA37_00870 [Mucilaginibacter gotjawali]